MTSLERFLDIIARSFPSWTRPFDEEAHEVIERLDPDKIYVENVRRILSTTEESAREACEAAVRQGVFSRYIEVLCPDGTQAAFAETEDELPEYVTCWVVEGNEEFPTKMKTDDLDKMKFYRINEPSRSAETG